MIDGVHFLLCSTDPVAGQAALNTILKSRCVPAGEGRLIFALPPAEVATHIGSGTFVHRHADHDLQGLIAYLMCDDLAATAQALKADGFACTENEESEFGLKTTLLLPSGAELGLYQPSHETPMRRAAASEQPSPRDD